MYIEVERNKGDVKQQGLGWREIRRRVKLSSVQGPVNIEVEFKKEKEDASGGGASQLERRSS